MKAFVGLVVVGLIVALFVGFSFTEEPQPTVIDSAQRQAAVADARIALASTQEECISLADDTFGQSVTEAVNYFGLKPDFQRVFREDGESRPGTPSNRQREDLRSQFDSLGHAGLALLMCLRYLDDRGIVSLGESVPAVAEQLEQSGEVDE